MTAKRRPPLSRADLITAHVKHARELVGGAVYMLRRAAELAHQTERDALLREAARLEGSNE